VFEAHLDGSVSGLTTGETREATKTVAGRGEVSIKATRMTAAFGGSGDGKRGE
jgi:hypothetical protein